MVIVGANGTGKTRLGVWIEQAATTKTHRITAQRVPLTIPPFVQPRVYEQAEANLIFGHYDPNQSRETRRGKKFHRRWGNDPYTFMLTDFEHVLALLFADETKRNRAYSQAALNTLPTNKPQKCNLDTLLDIWLSVMPQRTLTILDGKIEAKTNSGSKYEARHMSDGERVTIYLIGQAICAPKDSIIIIDEPEIHVHRAIQALLWDKIQAARPDCTFVYITHDVDFAATRTEARKIWLKDYDGQNWIWDEIGRGPALPDASPVSVTW